MNNEAWPCWVLPLGDKTNNKTTPPKLILIYFITCFGKSKWPTCLTDLLVLFMFFKFTLLRKLMSPCFSIQTSLFFPGLPYRHPPSPPFLRWGTARVTEVNEKHNHDNMKPEAQFGLKALCLGVSHCIRWCKGFIWVNQNVTSALLKSPVGLLFARGWAFLMLLGL